MIATFVSDEVAEASVELNQHLEDVANSITARPIPPSFQDIRPGLRNVAFSVMDRFQQSAHQALEQLMEMGQMLVQMKLDLKRREYQIFLKELGWTNPKANKVIAFAKTFNGFDLWKLVPVSINTLFALCTKMYIDVVEQMKSLPSCTTESIEKLMKQTLQLRKPKQQQKSAVEWQQDASGGGRHLSINLYDDELGTLILHTAEEQQITAQEVISLAFKKSKKLEEVQREYVEAISEVREVQLEMQRQLIQKDERIKDLESILATYAQAKEPKHLTKAKPVIYIENFDTWEELASAINSESDRFVALLKLASGNSRSQFARLLSSCQMERISGFLIERNLR